MSTLWNKELELKLIECYQTEPILWQIKHKDHHDRNKTRDAWMRISEIMNIPVPELKKKKDSLMGSYRVYKKKVKDSIKDGASSKDIYKPSWFAYQTVNSFLGDGGESNETINTKESSPDFAIKEEEEEEEENLDCSIIEEDDESWYCHVKREVESSSENEDRQPVKSQTIRTCENPPELLTAGEIVKDALSTLKTTLNTKRNREEDSEFDLHIQIIGKKLRKLPEDDRLQFVCDIYKMFTHREQLKQPQTHNEESDDDDDKLFLLSLYSDLKSFPDHLKLDLKSKMINDLAEAQQDVCSSSRF